VSASRKALLATLRELCKETCRHTALLRRCVKLREKREKTGRLTKAEQAEWAAIRKGDR
jgi:hypothetical protein